MARKAVTSKAKKIGYMGSTTLKRAGVSLPYTKHELSEVIKCSMDPIYFIEKYCKIISLDKGLVPFLMWDFQKDSIMNLWKERKVISMMGRQQGKTTITAAYITWHITFQSHQNVALLSYKLSGSKEVLQRIKTMYENLPMFLQVGVTEWNKTSIELENGSRVFAAATSANSVTGKSLNLCYLDEYAVVSNNIAEDFNTSVWPTLSTGETTKLFVSSTPRGRNHFYRLWREAVEGTNGFKPLFYSWDLVPGRDQAWLEQQRTDLGELKFARDILCTFENSSNTLIKSQHIGTQVNRKPLREDKETRIFANPEKDHSYVAVSDTARGTENDYSTVVVIDASVSPYKVVCTYRSNTISTEIFPDKIKGIAKYYNDAYVVVETNDMGESVVNTLYDDLEYENVFKTSSATIEGWTKPEHLGLRTTVKTKRKGCEGLKNMMETGQLEVSDSRVIFELETFVAKRNSYAAEAGSHDDLVMPLVLFGWLTLQPYFKELVGTDRSEIYKEKLKAIQVNLDDLGMSVVEAEEVLIPSELDLISDEFKWMFNTELLNCYSPTDDEDSLYVL